MVRRFGKHVHLEVGISQFKAECLKLLEELQFRGGEIVVTKRGKPIAVVRPRLRRAQAIGGAWKGIVKPVGDIVHVDRSKDWDALK